jgi:PDZ domain-containing protein
VPHGLNDAQNRRLGQDEMQISQQAAAAAALQSLGARIPRNASGAVVVEVEKGLPAAGHLKVHDVIESVDGVAVHTALDLEKAMAPKPPGTLVHFQVRRNGQSVTVPLRTVPASRGSRRGIVGILLNQAGVAFNVQGVGGPSAGLAFALEILEQLGQNVDRGHRIAATGEISPNGAVHPIGGIKQKTIGARRAGVDAFLVPAGDNARDARKYAHGLRIIPVKSFQQALKALATLPQA